VEEMMRIKRSAASAGTIVLLAAEEGVLVIVFVAGPKSVARMMRKLTR